MLRHFPYQHPVFGRAGAKWEGSEGVRRSPYYWWWEFLRRSERYKKTCESKGDGPLSKLYLDFGDVFCSDFKRWWSHEDRGANLFANQRPDALVSIVEPGIRTSSDAGILTVQIPLNLPRKHIETKIGQMLDKLHQGRRGIRYLKSTSARYTVSSNVSTVALKLRLKILDDRLSNPEKTLWQLGIDNVPSLRCETLTMRNGKPYLDPSRKNVISAVVSRYLRDAKQTVLNVEKGQFP